MKKTYLIPAMQVSNDTVDGGSALTKEDTTWDIWED